MKTVNVKFLYNERNKDLFAFFPDEIFDRQGNKTCYSLIGQHASCSEGYAKESREANPVQYRELLKELKGIGYKINILP